MICHQEASTQNIGYLKQLMTLQRPEFWSIGHIGIVIGYLYDPKFMVPDTPQNSNQPKGCDGLQPRARRPSSSPGCGSAFKSSLRTAEEVEGSKRHSQWVHVATYISVP